MSVVTSSMRVGFAIRTSEAWLKLLVCMCSALQLTCSIPSCIEGTTYPTSPLHPFMYEFHFVVQLLSASMCAPTGCASALPCKSAPEGEGGLWRFQCTGVLFKGLLFQGIGLALPKPTVFSKSQYVYALPLSVSCAMKKLSNPALAKLTQIF